MVITKSSTQLLRNDVSKANFKNRELIKQFDKSFSYWNTKMTEVEKMSKGMQLFSQPLMELFSLKIDKLEADVATMLSTHANLPEMENGPHLASHNI